MPLCAALLFASAVPTDHEGLEGRRPLPGSLGPLVQAAARRLRAAPRRQSPERRAADVLRLLLAGAAAVSALRAWLWDDLGAIPSAEALLAETVAAATAAEMGAVAQDWPAPPTAVRSPLGLPLPGEDSGFARCVQQLVVDGRPPPVALPPLFALHRLLRDVPSQQTWLRALCAAPRRFPFDLRWSAVQLALLNEHFLHPLCAGAAERAPQLSTGLGLALAYLLAAELQRAARSRVAPAGEHLPLDRGVAAAETMLLSSSAEAADADVSRTWRCLLSALCSVHWGEGLATQYVRLALQPVDPHLLSAAPLWGVTLDAPQRGGGILFAPSFPDLCSAPTTAGDLAHAHDTPAGSPSQPTPRGNVAGLLTSSPAILAAVALRHPAAQLTLLEQWWALAAYCGNGGAAAEERAAKSGALFESLRSARLAGVHPFASFSSSGPPPPPPPQAPRRLGFKRLRDEVERPRSFWCMIPLGDGEGKCWRVELDAGRYTGLQEEVARDPTPAPQPTAEAVPAWRSTATVPLSELLWAAEAAVSKAFTAAVGRCLAAGAPRRRVTLFCSSPLVAPVSRVGQVLREAQESSADGTATPRRVAAEALAAVCAAFCTYSVFRWLVAGIFELERSEVAFGRSAAALAALSNELRRRFAGEATATELGRSFPSAAPPADHSAAVEAVLCVLGEVQTLSLALRHAWGPELGFLLRYSPVTHAALPALLDAVRRWASWGEECPETGAASRARTLTAELAVLFGCPEADASE